MKKQIIYDPDKKTMQIDGKFFREKSIVLKKDKHVQNIIFEEFDPKELETVTDYIVGKIKSKLTKEDVIKDALSEIPTTELHKIRKALIKGTKPKPYRGCLNIKVGKHEISIRD